MSVILTPTFKKVKLLANVLVNQMWMDLIVIIVWMVSSNSLVLLMKAVSYSVLVIRKDLHLKTVMKILDGVSAKTMSMEQNVMSAN